MPQHPKLVNRGAAGLLSKFTPESSVLPEQPAVKIVKNKIAACLTALIVPIDSVNPDPMNARLHGEQNIQSIKDSLCMYGQTKPIVVRKQTSVVMAGNGTLQSAKELGWTKIAASIVPMTDLEAAGYGVADNRTAEHATWNLEVLSRILRLQNEAGVASPGWSPAEILAARMHGVPVEVDVDKVPEAPAVPVTKKGDLWTMGKHRLLCGDSSNVKDIKRLMDGKKAVLMATDPPYGVDLAGQKYNPRAKDWDGIVGDKVQGGDLRQFMKSFITNWTAFVNEQTAFYFWSAAMNEGFESLLGIKDAGLHVQSQIIWAKNCLVLGQSDYHWMHENCWYAFFKGKKHRWLGQRDKTSVWQVKKVSNADYLHPMQKPVELYEHPIRHHTHPGEVVAEPFSGSGTQLIAAQTLGRACYAMEIDEKFCDVALQRFLDLTGISPVRADGKSFQQLVAAKPAQNGKTGAKSGGK